MKRAFLALALVGAWAHAQEAEESLAFTSYELGITFNYPKTWETTTDKNSTKFRFSVDGSTTPAVLEVYSANFRAETDIWQISQKTVAEQMRHQVTRQWQEEILGVPLLLTQSTGKEQDKEMVIVSGLVYSATSRKLVFRLTAAATDFEKADFAWRTVMQSLRTIDGSLPKPEDPARPVTDADLKPLTRPPKKMVFKPQERDPATFIKGPVDVEVQAGGKAFKLHAPQGWAFEKTESGFVAKNAALGVDVAIGVFSTLDSEPPGKALLSQSGRSLENYSKVTKREEKGPTLSKSGANRVTIYREGTGTDGKPMWSFDAVGQSADVYWIATLLRQTAADSKTRAALDELFEVLCLVPVATP